MHGELQKLKPIYDLYTEQKSARQDWACILWKDAKLGDLVASTREFISRFRQRPRRMRALPAAKMLNTILRNFLESLLLIQNLKDDAMRDRHWKQLMEKTGISFDMDPQTFTLEGVFAMQLHQFADVISTVVNNAQREVVIEKNLEDIKNIWLEMRFSLSPYTKCNKEPCFILASVEEPSQIMEDHMMSLQSIGASRHATPFLAIVRQWERDLTIVSDTLDLWVAVQQKWMYLEAIFMGGDVAKQLPNEAKRFETIDKMFRKIMKQTQETQYVMKSCLADRRLDSLRMMDNELELCQKALNDYLDAKRNAFPRFYFISDDEVLNILGGKEAEAIQEHIIKMFDNIGKLKFSYSSHSSDIFVAALISFEGETMEFLKPVLVFGKVEEWLTAMEAEMRRTNHWITKRAVFYYCYQKSRVDWMFDFQGMVVIAASQIWFTWEIEDVFRSFKQGNRSAMKEYDKKLEGQLSEMVYRIRTELTPNDMKKLETVLILDVHCKDIVERFIRDSIMSPDEFGWESQLRFYWVRKLDSLVIRQCSAEFNYGNEYFGLNGRLVITPLTDRIYLTVTQALSLCLGGAPAGPAGTGKTETIKDLAKALGLLCVVTNCGENMDYKSFAKLLSGLCRSGAWGCFDEFNRIEVSVLSVVSSQIKSIQNALQTKASIFQFEGSELPLDRRVGIFITMNPGYAGRTELPESVKALFRPVVVIVPDLEYICEIMLFSQGFLTARDLAKKVTALYRLAKEQLSQQHHYDFGLRALRSLLVMAGVIRRKNPNLREDQLLMRALRDSNIPKLVHEDAPLFMGLIQDLFPGIEFEAAQMIPELVEATHAVLEHLQYTIVEEQVVKIVQLHETLHYRHSVMVVGPTCGGKSVVLEVYVRALKQLGINSKMYTINPKDRSVNDLYGYLEPTSREWIDGLLSYLFRLINQFTDAAERRFLLFDGDVDALWIENMNSVMDDNKLLTLVNGERIRLQPYCSLLFEVADLQYASPATVSRCGMVYVDPTNLGYTPYWQSWVSGIPVSMQTTLNALFKKYVGVIMDFIFDGILPPSIGRQMTAAPQTGEERNKGGKDNGGMAIGGGGMGIAGKESGASSGTPKLKLVLPLVKMNLIVQFCTLLQTQLDLGGHPGMEKTEIEVTQCLDLENAHESVKFSVLEKALPPRNHGSLSPSVHGSTQQQVYQPSSSIYGATPSLSQALSQGMSHDSNNEVTIDNPDVLESVFLFSLCWAFSGVLSAADQRTFDNLIKILSSLPQMDEGPGDQPAKPGTIPIHFPLLTDYMFNNSTLYWVPWKSMVPNYVHDTSVPFTSILVPTVETIKLNWLVEEHIKLRHPLVVIGETGTSKTATIESTLKSLDPDTNSQLILNFSSRTTGNDVRRMLNANVEKRAKGVYGPIPGKKLVVFIDDMNMPKEDEYGTQQPIALLRVVIGRGGMYQQGTDLSWRSLRDMTYTAAIGPTGGGRQSLDPRFLSLFTVYHALQPSSESLFSIFSSILSCHLSNGFSRKLHAYVDKFTHLSLLVYREIRDEMLPTPLKFHYTFSMRELSRLLQGLLQSSSERFKGPKKFLRLWRHECLRVFRDRMVDETDVAEINDIILQRMNEAFSDEVSYASMDPILFGDYWAAASEEDARLYEDMQDYEVCKAIVEELLFGYRETEGNMDLVLFNDALEHLGAIHRILRLDGGHALLVGLSGSGRRSLAKLAAYIAEVKTFEILLRRGYSENEFREDLKALYTTMSTDKDDHMFLLPEEHIQNESFLELINNMLTTGFVNSLFGEEEKDEIQQNIWTEAEARIRAEAQAAGALTVLVNKETVWSYFRGNCASRLHIVLCMNPAGDTLRTRCRDFPGIVKCTTIDWFFPWPEQALYAVACSLIDPKFSQVPSPYWEAVITNVVNIHRSVQNASMEYKRQLRRINYVTATNYILFITGFLKLLEDKTNENIAQQKRLQGGLEKLHETAIQIDELNVKLAVQKVVLEEKTTSIEALIEEINEATVIATAKKTQAQEKSVELGKQAKVIVAEKKEAETALAEALPAVEAARNALDELEKNDVTEIRAFATPPKPVQMVGEALCHILQANEISWKAARGLMADANFISTLQQMDVEAIPLKNIQNLKDLIAKRKMTYDDVRSASKAGGGFYKFVLAVITFHDVAREVRPKRERVKALERDYNKARRDLQRLQEEVVQLEETLFNLRRQFSAAQTEMENLKKEMEVMRRQLMAAQKLTEGLGSEKERWISEVASLKKEQKCLLGDSLIAAAFLCYLGPFTSEFRDRLLCKEWLIPMIQDEIPVTEDLQVNNILATEVEVALWNSQGLPSDELSVQNAILTLKGPTCPVCIDPQGQASRWIKEMGRNPKDDSRSARVTTQNDPNFLRTVENSIKQGLACIIEGVEETLDPALNNLIARNTRVEKGREVVMLGDREVEYDPNFRLYLVTKMSNPHFSPTLYSRALIINYTVTLTGLEGQLLSALVKHEHRELEERREALILETSENKRILKELEDRLLLELATQTGNILDNWELIGTLEDTKNKAVDVGRQLAQGAIVSKDVERQRDAFRPAARRGAILFFVLADLAMVGPMYQFSLSAYLTVFLKALKKAMPHSSLPKRLSNIKNALTYATYCYGCMGVFEEHKMLLSFELALRLQQDENMIRLKELAFLVRGNVALSDHLHPQPHAWIPDTVWRDLVYMSAFLPKHFSKLPKDVRILGDQWEKWFESKNPEVQPYPGRYAKLRPFLRLCLIRCWRMDRIPMAIVHYVVKVLGKQYVDPPITNLADVLASTNPTIPIVLIVQPGSDPQTQLANLAQQLEFGHTRIKYLSMGQGQEPHAENLFVQCAARGNWLLLQNCHLLIRFIPTLEKLLDDLTKPHPDFRLWMTTEMVNNFPIGMLQRSYKVVMEPPSGLKQNLAAGVSKLSHEQFVSCAHPNYRPCLFTLIFLHAVLQERRRYGKLGWNVSYDFADSDFQVSLRILQISLAKSEEKKTEISWDTIKYLIGEVMYGGRTIDSYDRRILTTYMDEYFGDFLFDTFQPFRFYQDDRVEYFIPEEPPGFGNYKDLYAEYVSHLPSAHKPEVLGLHPNAAIGYSVRFARSMWTNLLMLHSETEVVGGVPSAQRLSQVAASAFPTNSEFGSERHLSFIAPLPRYRTSIRMDLEAMDSAEQDGDSQEAGTISSESDRDAEQDEHKELDGEEDGGLPALEDPEGTEQRRRAASVSASTKSRSSLASFNDFTAAQVAAPPASSREATIRRLSDSILSRLPPLFDAEGLKRKHMGTEISPTIIVLIQELDRFNLILAKILSSLKDLKQAFDGQIGMSEELDDIARHLANGLIPASWRRLVPQTEKSLPDWIQHLLRRADQYKKWMTTGKSEPAVMWLSGLHLPQSYLTALIQKACRKHGWALDKCALQTTVTDIVPEEVHTVLMAPELGCHVNGLYIEGCAWSVEEGCLVRQTPRELLQELPIVKLTPIEKHRLKLTSTVPVPVYVTSQRRNAMGEGFVTSLDMPTHEHPSHWILQGAAILLNTD
ncbi:hypothetical protein CRM22_002727 [Opisthorchis felineus]|uniref:AAA+ ATPase domain-containing protein n=1 Tax=Opisthorchis felineus TaxID=147828 RepID=A0A4V3SG79_OPIFE|nr:hypothetical protein CRM22_002727 [Opisthorchis felineus]